MHSIMMKFLSKLKKRRQPIVHEPPVMSDYLFESEHEKCQAVLRSLLQLDGNKNCADCNVQNPTWASWNIGIFLCINCASIHRSLGTTVSRVKSITLDKWTSDQLRSLETMGNTKSRGLYEYLLPEGYVRPVTRESLQIFIEKKYVDKFYYSEDRGRGQSMPLSINLDKKKKRAIKYTNQIVKLNVDQFEQLNAQPALIPSNICILKPEKKDDKPIDELLLNFDPLFRGLDNDTSQSKLTVRSRKVSPFNPGKKISNESILRLYDTPPAIAYNFADKSGSTLIQDNRSISPRFANTKKTNAEISGKQNLLETDELFFIRKQHK